MPPRLTILSKMYLCLFIASLEGSTAPRLPSSCVRTHRWPSKENSFRRLARGPRSADLLCGTSRALRLHLVRDAGWSANSGSQPAIEEEDATRAVSCRGHDCGARDGDYAGHCRTVGTRSTGLKWKSVGFD